MRELRRLCRRISLARSRRETGAVAVEFALVLPLLVMLLLGITTTGLVYADSLAIANSAREGARLGSAIDFNSDPTGWANSVQARVRQVYFNAGTSLSTSQVCVLLVDPSTSPETVKASPTTPSDCATDAGKPASPATYSAGSCVVKVWVQKPARIDLGITSLPTFTISSRSVSMYGRTSGPCVTP